MRIAPRFRLPHRATERRRAPLQRGIQLFLVLVVLIAGLPFAFTPPVAANAVSAYGCTIDPEKPKENDGKLAAKARFQCSSALAGRAIRTELQQRRADGNYYTVAKSIVVRKVPGTYTGQWYGAGSEWVGGCKKVSGTRKFKSIIMITDGEGNVEQTASNPEEFGRDCVDADDNIPLVALVFGSNDIEDCSVVLEEISDPGDEEIPDPDNDFLDPDFRSDQAPCEAGVVSSMVTASSDAQWVLAVSGVEQGLSRPRSFDGGEGEQIANITPLSGNSEQDAIAIAEREWHFHSLFSEEAEGIPDFEEAEISAAQTGPCQKGKINARRRKTIRYKSELGNTEIRVRIDYRRVTCKTWRIYNVDTTLMRGAHPVNASSHTYDLARDFGSDFPFKPLTYDWGCLPLPKDARKYMKAEGKWEIVPSRTVWFEHASYVFSYDFPDRFCRFNGGVHATGGTHLPGPHK